MSYLAKLTQSATDASHENELEVPEYGKRRRVGWDAIVAIYIATIVFANIASVKIVALAGLSFTAGALFYPLTFTSLDLATEIWGRRRSLGLVGLGFCISLLAVLGARLVVAVPPAPFFHDNKQVAFVFGSAPRIVIASLLTFPVSQSLDVLIFNSVRTLTRGRWLWLRNTISTVMSEFVDSAMFVTLGFVGTISSSQLWTVIWGQFAIKMVLGLFETPLVYGGRLAILGRRGSHVAQRSAH